MARSGRFGRLPRRAPDLSGAIASMIAQYWSQQEQNMVDAWQNGGEVDGQKVTDARMIQFWKDRRDSVSRDDPLWDHYDNLIGQYDFRIRESVVGLKYAQKKMTAREVAHWYSGEAGNYPKDSEMYRTVAGQAAKFLNAARANASANRTATETKRYNKNVKNIYDEKIAPFAFRQNVFDQVTRWLTTGGPMSTSGEPGDQGIGTTSLTYTEGGPNVFDMAQDVIREAETDPNSVLHAWWVQEVLPAAAKFGYVPTAADFTEEGVRLAGNKAINGHNDLIDLAKKHPDIVDVDKVTASETAAIHSTTTSVEFVATNDDVQKYHQYHNQLDTVLFDADATPEQKLNAYTKYFSDLDSLAAANPDNPTLAASLYVEKRAILGNPSGWGRTIAENAMNVGFGTEGSRDPFGGQQLTDPAGGGSNIDVLREASDYATLTQQVTDVRDGKAVYVRDPKTKEWTTLPVTQIQDFYGPGNYAVIPKTLPSVQILKAGTGERDQIEGNATTDYIGPGTGSQVIQVVDMVVRAQVPGAYDQFTGAPLPGGEAAPFSDTTIGKIAFIPADGSQPARQIYGIYNAQHILQWTPVAPFLPGTAGAGQLVGGQNGSPSQFVIDANLSDPAVGSYLFSKDKVTDPVTHKVTENAGTFKPQNMIDHSLLIPGSAFTFNNIALTNFAADPGHREVLASMDPTHVLQIASSSPEMNVNDPNQINQLWTDINVVREVSALDDWAALNSITKARSGGDPSLWDNLPQPTYTPIQYDFLKDVPFFGKSLYAGQARPVQTDINPAILALASPEAASSLARWNKAQLPFGTGTPIAAPPGYVPPATALPSGAPPADQWPAARPPGLAEYLWSQDQNGQVNTGAQPNSYGQPQIQLSGQVTIPQLPNAYVPATTPVATGQPTPTPTPTPVYTPPANPWTTPSVPTIPGPYGGKISKLPTNW